MTQPLTPEQIAEIKAKAEAAFEHSSFPSPILSLIATLEARDAAFEEMLEALKPFANVGPIEWDEYDYKERIHAKVNMPIQRFKAARAAIAQAEKVK